jgi:deoxyhypusine synthase
MSQPAPLSPKEIAALDQLIAKVKEDAGFIDVIVPAIKWALVTTVLIAGAQVRADVLESAEGKLLQGKASAQDLVAIRKSLVGIK